MSRMLRLIERDEKILEFLCNAETLSEAEYRKGDTLLTPDAIAVWKAHSRHLEWQSWGGFWVYSRHQNYPV